MIKIDEEDVIRYRATLKEYISSLADEMTLDSLRTLHGCASALWGMDVAARKIERRVPRHGNVADVILCADDPHTARGISIVLGRSVEWDDGEGPKPIVLEMEPPRVLEN